MRFNLFVMLFFSVLISSNALTLHWCHHPDYEDNLQYSDYVAPSVNVVLHTNGWNPPWGETWYFKTMNNYLHRGIFVSPESGYVIYDGSPGYGTTVVNPPAPSGTLFTEGALFTSGGVASSNMYYTVTANPSLEWEEQNYPGDPPYVSSNMWQSVTMDIYGDAVSPPEWKYDCYFSIEGVAFFDGQTNKTVSASLYRDDVLTDTFYITASGAYHNQTALVHLEMPDNGKKVIEYYWKISSPVISGGSYNTQKAWTSGSNPDEYDYTVSMDWSELNTNAPPVDPPVTNTPPLPPNPTNQPPVTNWPAPPVPPENPVYPYPPAPNPSNNPPVPDPPVPDTNAPPVPDDDPYTGSTNALTYDALYTALRNALRDEGNAYDGNIGSNYNLDSSVTSILMTVNSYISNMNGAVVGISSNTDVILGKGSGILLGVRPVLSGALPASIGRISEFSLPWMNTTFVVSLNPYAEIISTVRAFCLWFLYLSAFWVSYKMICAALGRVR